MNLPTPLIAIAVATVLMPAITLADQRSATVTRVFNDVRVLPPNASPQPAQSGITVSGESAVATGVDSRAELRFPDKTLTRLGANSVFRLDPSTRSIELEDGVALLQVPKQLGGARVRTAAVTAAVSGTTVLVEYSKGKAIKIIVIEGEVNLYFNDRPSVFITLKEGDMIIMSPDDTSFPMPVKVDLDRLIKTSKLLDPRIFGPLGNDRQIQDALQNQVILQKKGELHKTSLLIEGRGTLVQIAQHSRDDALRTLIVDPDRPPVIEPPGSGGGGGGGDGHTGDDLPPFNAPPFFINEFHPLIGGFTLISTNPTIQTVEFMTLNDIEGTGTVHDPLTEGPLLVRLNQDPGSEDASMLYDAQGTWSVFRFLDLTIIGNPVIDSSVGPRNLLLASEGGVNFEYDFLVQGNPTIEMGAALDGLALMARKGSINFDTSMRIEGTSGTPQLLILDAASNVNFNGSDFLPTTPEFATIYLQDGRAEVMAGNNVNFDFGSIFAPEINIRAANDAILNGAVLSARNSVNVTAENNVETNFSRIEVNSSNDIFALSQATPEEINIIANSGNVLIGFSTELTANTINIQALLGNIEFNGANLNATDSIKAITHSATGSMLIGDTTMNANNLIRLYANGSSGLLDFVESTTLNANQVDLAGNTVRIRQGVTVQVTNPSGLKVYSNDHDYFNNGGPSNRGSFREGETLINVDRRDFNDRPAF